MGMSRRILEYTEPSMPTEEIYFEAIQNTISEAQYTVTNYESSELQTTRALTQNAIVSVQESIEFNKIGV